MEDKKLLRNVVALLSEHYDSVQIIVTRPDTNDNTTIEFEGSGNLFARIGSCREFVMINDEMTREFARRRIEDS